MVEYGDRAWVNTKLIIHIYTYVQIYIYIFTGTNILVWHCVISYRRLVSRDVRYSLTWPPPCELCLHVIWLTCCHSIISNLLETTLAPALHTCSHACVCVPPEGYIFRSLCFSLSLSHSLSVSLVLYLYINTCTYNVMYICIHVYIQMFQVHPGHTLHINNVWHACVISYQTCMYASLVFERHLIGKGMHIIIYIYIYSHYISSCMCYIYILSTIYPLHPSTLYSLLSIPYCLLSALYSQLPTFLLSTLSTYTVYIYILYICIYLFRALSYSHSQYFLFSLSSKSRSPQSVSLGIVRGMWQPLQRQSSYGKGGIGGEADIAQLGRIIGGPSPSTSILI